MSIFYVITNKNVINYLVTIVNIAFLGGCSNPVSIKHDDARRYYLPYEETKSRFLIQGYKGFFGHNGYELDFVMPVGSFVLAARSGTVVQVVENNISRCPLQKNCQNNLIYILHQDGSLGEYLHIKQNGACVIEGQRIERGDVIALSGNVGISVLPHLHFGVTRAVPSIPSFMDIDREGSGVPVGGRFYTSANEINHNFCEPSSK